MLWTFVIKFNAPGPRMDLRVVVAGLTVRQRVRAGAVLDPSWANASQWTHDDFKSRRYTPDAEPITLGESRYSNHHVRVVPLTLSDTGITTRLAQIRRSHPTFSGLCPVTAVCGRP